MSLWSSLGLSEDAPSSFGAFLKTASSAIESRIDNVLGTEPGASGSGSAATKSSPSTEDPEGAANAADIAASAAAGLAAFSKTTDDFFSSMMSSFAPAEPPKEEEAPKKEDEAVDPEDVPRREVSPEPSPTGLDRMRTGKSDPKPLDFREEGRSEDGHELHVPPAKDEERPSSAPHSADKRPLETERPSRKSADDVSARSPSFHEEETVATPRDNSSPASGESGDSDKHLTPGRTSADSGSQRARDSFDDTAARESLDSKPARDSMDARSMESRGALDGRVPPPPSPAIEPSPVSSLQRADSHPAVAIPIINADDVSEGSASSPSPLPEPSPVVSRKSTDSRLSMDARPPPAPSPTPRTPDKPLSAADSVDSAALARVVGERERQLMTAMEENRSLHEQVEQLRSFISALERKTSGGGDPELRRLLEEREEEVAAKEQIINELLAEGEKLSKAELKSAQAIKDLRKEKKEADKAAQELRKKFDVTVTEMAELKSSIIGLQEGEKRFQDAVRTLNELNDAQNKQIVKLEQEASQVRDEKGNLQMALERAWAELSETRRLAAAQNSQAQSEALEKEIKTNQELHAQLEQIRREKDKGDGEARKEIADLRAALARSEEESGWKEDNLRKEVSIIQSRLRAAESRNEDLSANVQDSTRPLLRQIEALQTQNQAAQKNWEQAEKTLSARLLEAEIEREKAAIRERGWGERVSELSTRVATVESQLQIERQEKSRLNAELEAARVRTGDIEAAHNDLMAKFEIQKTVHSRALDDAKDGYQRMLRERLQEEREQWEQKHKEEERMRQAEPKREPEKSKLKLDTRANAGREASADRLALSASATSPVSLDLQTNGGANPGHVIDRLHGMVKQLEGQVGSMQSQLQMALRTRDELADELVKVTGENETLKQSLAKVEQLEKELADLGNRYTASLDLLGEKTEELEELRQDLFDVKSMYKEQVSELATALAKAQAPSQ